MRKLRQYRQGDVLLVETRTDIPSAAIPVPSTTGRLVLAAGEATGHAHVLVAPDAELWEVVDGRDTALAVERFLRVRARTAELVHEEHATITVPPGLYRVVRQREYAPESVRQVTD